MMGAEEKLIRDIASIVKGAVIAHDPTAGFALFFGFGSEFAYVSNGDRGDVVNMLEEWLERTSGDLRVGSGPVETSETKDKRLLLERKCAEIGKTIGEVSGVLLFVFNFGPANTGNLAYFTNIPTARQGIERWVKRQRGTS